MLSISLRSPHACLFSPLFSSLYTCSAPSMYVTLRDVGQQLKANIETLTNEKPHVVVGTPGRILDLINRKHLDLSHVKHFVLDECDAMLKELSWRRDVQAIFKSTSTPPDKQVMMYSATLDKDVRPVCRKFCQDVSLVYICMLYVFVSHVYLHY